MPEAEHPPQAERVPTGVAGLDAILCGGLLRGSACILQGTPGAGKTILANQIAFHRAAQGEKVLYFTLLSESHALLLTHLAAFPFVDRGLIPDRLLYVSGYPVLDAEGPDGLLRLIAREIRRHSARFVVLDGLFVVHDAIGSEREFRRFVHELQGLSHLQNCTLLILTNQVRRASDPEYTMVDGWIELGDQIIDARAVRELHVRKLRGGAVLRGRHRFRITDSGIQVFPRLETVAVAPQTGGAEAGRLGSGVAELDRMLCGGLPADSTTLLLGPPGGGKTTLGLHFLAQSSREAPGLLFGFYETPERLRAKAATIGIDLDRRIADGAVEILWQAEFETSIDELGHRLLAAVRRRGTKRLFVDGIGGFREALVHPGRLHAYMTALSQTLRALGVTVIFSQESPQLFRTEDLRIEEISPIIENIFLMRYVQDEDRIRKRFSILKVRDSDFDPFAVEYAIGAGGIAFAKPPKGAVRPPLPAGEREGQTRGP